MSDHESTEFIGHDRYGIGYLKCECGTKYPADASACPHAPSDMKLNTK